MVSLLDNWMGIRMNEEWYQTLHHLYFRWTENPIYVSTDRRSGNGLKCGKGVWSHINVKERLKRLKSLKLLCYCTPYSRVETIESNGSTLSATKHLNLTKRKEKEKQINVMRGRWGRMKVFLVSIRSIQKCWWSPLFFCIGVRCGVGGWWDHDYQTS